MIYTSPIDSFYDYKFGKLPYRSLKCKRDHHTSIEWLLKVGTVNYLNDHNYTRITEFKQLTGQDYNRTSTVEEYPTLEGDP